MPGAHRRSPGNGSARGGRYGIDVDEDAVSRFRAGLASGLGLRVYGEATVFAPGGLGRDSNEGYDAFIPLIDAGISLYVWSSQRFLALILFTCKAFDSDRAVDYTREFFAWSEHEHQEF